jgi:hypothetical protein
MEERTAGKKERKKKEKNLGPVLAASKITAGPGGLNLGIDSSSFEERTRT